MVVVGLGDCSFEWLVSLSVRWQKLLRNSTFQTVFVVGLIVCLGLVFWGSGTIMNTKIMPLLAVISGSMCIPYDGACDGWSHPFDRTLHVGDLIVIQGVDPQDLNTNYPNSDIIVFYSPNNPDELIVHRIIGVTTFSGNLYFQTKGDGNGNPWPETPDSALDSWDYNSPPGVPQSMVVGKVVMRIPWIGSIAMTLQAWGATESTVLPIIIVLLIVLIVVDFVAPLLKRRKTALNQD